MTDPIASYLALGDSMSIDDFPGPGLGAASLLFVNDDEVFPEFAGRSLSARNPEARFTNLARDGATTRDVLRILEEDEPELVAPGIVSLTVGGNDLLGSTFRPGAQSVEDIAGRIDSVVEEILVTLRPCLLLLGTIYDPTDGVGDLWTPGHPHRTAQAALLALNEAIRSFGARAGVAIAEVHDHFLGHGSHHGDPENPHHDAEDPTCWVKLNIEPNRRGGSEVRRVFWDALARWEASRLD